MTSYPQPAAEPSAAVATSVSTRYAQLLYASFDDGSGVGGGWQVKDTVGEVSDEERELLIARVVTQFDVDPPLPEFPTTGQIANRPARLAYATVSPTAAAYWHTVDAGADATGRPGNVMAHLLLDRDLRMPSELRPIQLWQSPDWCRPYGAPEVLATTLAADRPPAPNPTVTAQTSVHFLNGTDVDRQGVFRVLLDAVYAAMSGGPKVVLVTDEDHGPKWLAALSFFMSPGTARRFSWSTFDKATQAATDLRRGVDLVIVPRSAVAGLGRGDWVIIDEADEPTVRELGAAHTTKHAQVVVTAWSTLTEGVLGDDEATAVALLARQDAIAAEVGDHDLSPLWPLAAAVLGERELSEFHDDARRAVADEAPGHLPETGTVADLVADATEATAPTDAAEALKRLRGAQGRGGNPRAADQFTRVAFADPNYLDQLVLTDVPQVRTVAGARWGPAVERLLDEMEAQLPDPSGLSARRLLRVIALLDLLAADEPAFAKARDRIFQMLKAADVTCLAGPTAQVITGQPDLPPNVRKAALQPAVASLPSSTLATIDSSVWRWVMADGPGDSSSSAISTPANPSATDRVLYPWFVDALIRHDRTADIPPERLTELAKDALLWAVEAEQISDVDCRQLATRLAGVAQFDGPTLIDLFTRWPQRVSPAMVITTMSYEPTSPELIGLIASLPIESDAADPWSSNAIAAARLRQLGTAPRPLSPAATQAAITDAAPAVFATLPPEHVGQLTTDLATALCAAFVAAQSTEQEWADPETPVAQALRVRMRRSDVTVVDLLADFAVAAAIDVEWLAAQAFLATLDTELGFNNKVGSLMDRSKFDEVVTRLVERDAYRGPRDSATLRDAAWAIVRLGTAERAEGFFARYPKAARDWFRDHRF